MDIVCYMFIIFLVYSWLIIFYIFVILLLYLKASLLPPAPLEARAWLAEWLLPEWLAAGWLLAGAQQPDTSGNGG